MANHDCRWSGDHECAGDVGSMQARKLIDVTAAGRLSVRGVMRRLAVGQHRCVSISRTVSMPPQPQPPLFPIPRPLLPSRSQWRKMRACSSLAAMIIMRIYIPWLPRVVSQLYTPMSSTLRWLADDMPLPLSMSKVNNNIHRPTRTANGNVCWRPAISATGIIALSIARARHSPCPQRWCGGGGGGNSSPASPFHFHFDNALVVSSFWCIESIATIHRPSVLN